MDWLREKRTLGEELVAIVETNACCVDAIQVMTGCTFGKGNQIYNDYGKMDFTFFNHRTGQGVRLAMKPETFRVSERQIELSQKTRDGSITDAEQAELKALGMQRTVEVLDTRAEDLFAMAPVTAGMPDKARIEPTMASKLASVGVVLAFRGCL